MSCWDEVVIVERKGSRRSDGPVPSGGSGERLPCEGEKAGKRAGRPSQRGKPAERMTLALERSVPPAPEPP